MAFSPSSWSRRCVEISQSNAATALTFILDDGSGSVTILESYRALLAADFHPVRSIGAFGQYSVFSATDSEHLEFHWYSAEVCAALGC